MKIRILQNSGWVFVYVRNQLKAKHMLNNLEFITKWLKDAWIMDRDFKIDDYKQLDDFLKLRNDIKRFVFRDDDYVFTPFELYKIVDPEAEENFIDVAKYLLEKYEYREEEYEEILEFII